MHGNNFKIMMRVLLLTNLFIFSGLSATENDQTHNEIAIESRESEPTLTLAAHTPLPEYAALPDAPESEERVDDPTPPPPSPLSEEQFYTHQLSLIRARIKADFLSLNPGHEAEYDRLIQDLLDIHTDAFAIYERCFQELRENNDAIKANRPAPHGTNQNVHRFDAFANKNLAKLLNIGRRLHLGRPVPIQDAITEAKAIAQFPTTWRDQNGQHHDCLTPVYHGFLKPDELELFSRSITFAIDLFKDDNENGLAQMGENRDNWELHGGCQPGRLNRIFLSYMRMMSFLLPEAS